MKKVILFALILSPITLWAQKGDFVLTGKAGSYNAPAKIYLLYFQGDRKVRDSSAIDHGTFRIESPLIQPVRALLILDHTGKGADAARYEKNSDQTTICLENGSFAVSAKDSVKNAIVNGSKLNNEFAAYTTSLIKLNQTIKTLKDEYSAASVDQKKDRTYTNALDKKVAEANEDKKEIQRQFITQHPDSYISIVALSELAGYNVGRIDVAAIEPLYAGLSANVRNSIEGTDLAKLLNEAKNFAIGAAGPAFILNDVNGQPVSLTGFRGKYVLIDFWASWAPPTREEHPNMLKLYDKYKATNFTILGVALEQPDQKEAWLAAIKADGLPWTQVSDFKLWKSEAAKLYHIGYLPANYLIDPDGKIIAKNLYGEMLNKKLDELLGK
jgi:peroxiredoxin